MRKHLLVTVALSIFCIPTSSISQQLPKGDMGSADIHWRNDLPPKRDFEVKCIGVFDKHGAGECRLFFSEGRLRVDNARGITRDQVLYYAYHLERNKKYFNIVYRTSDDRVSEAQFYFNHSAEAKAFNNTWILFLGDELNQLGETTNENESGVLPTLR